jgi:hypothetical protein
MTTLGGLGHALPYLVPGNAGVVVFFELWAIAYIRTRYIDTPFPNLPRPFAVKWGKGHTAAGRFIRHGRRFYD